MHPNSTRWTIKTHNLAKSVYSMVSDPVCVTVSVVYERERERRSVNELGVTLPKEGYKIIVLEMRSQLAYV